MSRIDQALRVWEVGNGVKTAEPGTIPSSSASSLDHYAHEEPMLPRPPQDPKPWPSSTSRSRQARETRFPDNADIQARLVTGASSTVSLEQYRRLAAALHEEQVHRQLKTVMITSALPQDGKTLTVVNLALTLSHSYARRVLVIDADLRWPGLHAVLDVPNHRGLSEALRDRQLELPIVQLSSRLSVLTAGRPGPTPLASLTSSRMGEVIEACAAQFDWVLIDTAPVGVLPDAQVLARFAGAVILVIGAGSTPAPAVERAIAELGGSDSILGTVLNRVDQRRIPSADYYGHYGSSHDPG
jgi:capsular exopolysaccharide synthesis family protein